MTEQEMKEVLEEEVLFMEVLQEDINNRCRSCKHAGCADICDQCGAASMTYMTVTSPAPYHTEIITMQMLLASRLAAIYRLSGRKWLDIQLYDRNEELVSTIVRLDYIGAKQIVCDISDNYVIDLYLSDDHRTVHIYKEKSRKGGQNHESGTIID